MTTIIMKEHDNGVTIGFDSRVTQGNHAHEGASDKVFVNNGTIIGHSGEVADARVLQYAALPAPEPGDWDTDRFVTLKLLPALRGALEAAGRLQEEEGRQVMTSNLLLVVAGRVYEAPRGFGWLRRKDQTYTVGSGWQFALGALSAGAPIRIALEVAALHDTATGDSVSIVQSQELLEQHTNHEEMRIAA